MTVENVIECCVFYRYQGQLMVRESFGTKTREYFYLN